MSQAYLERIGLDRDEIGPLDEAGLRRVVAAHAASAPFENLRAHRAETISVDIEDILERIVARREGGVCYELNGGLGWLLQELGADVELIAAQVLMGAEGSGGPGLPMSHMALIVRLPDGSAPLLVDAGFGGETIVRPAPADGETVTTARGASYQVDLRPRRLADFAGVAWWHSTSPDSRFMQSLVVSSTRADGITTLSGRGEETVEWRFRGTRDAEARPVDVAAAQAIANEVFGLRSRLPRRVLRYAPVGAE